MTYTPRRAHKNTRKVSKKKEDRVASEIGGHRVPASGAMAHSKDDVRAQGKVRVEHKYTAKDSYRFDPRDFIGLKKRANSMGEQPVFIVELSNGRTKIAITQDHLPSGISGLVLSNTKTYLFKEENLKELEREAGSRPYLLVVGFVGAHASGEQFYVTPYSAYLETLHGN